MCGWHRARYVIGMRAALSFFLVLVIAGVLGVLLLGVIGVARGGEPRRSNRLMRWRVLLQAIALLVLAILLGLGRS